MMTDQEKLELIETALKQLYEFLATPSKGVVSISFNGMSKSIDRKGVLDEIKFLESEKEKLKPSRTYLRTIQL